MGKTASNNKSIFIIFIWFNGKKIYFFIIFIFWIFIHFSVAVAIMKRRKPFSVFYFILFLLFYSQERSKKKQKKNWKHTFFMLWLSNIEGITVKFFLIIILIFMGKHLSLFIGWWAFSWIFFSVFSYVLFAVFGVHELFLKG